MKRRESYIGVWMIRPAKKTCITTDLGEIASLYSQLNYRNTSYGPLRIDFTSPKVMIIRLGAE